MWDSGISIFNKQCSGLSPRGEHAPGQAAEPTAGPGEHEGGWSPRPGPTPTVRGGSSSSVVEAKVLKKTPRPKYLSCLLVTMPEGPSSTSHCKAPSSLSPHFLSKLICLRVPDSEEEKLIFTRV